MILNGRMSDDRIRNEYLFLNKPVVKNTIIFTFLLPL